jgi:hypothetical protein
VQRDGTTDEHRPAERRELFWVVTGAAFTSPAPVFRMDVWNQPVGRDECPAADEDTHGYCRQPSLV